MDPDRAVEAGTRCLIADRDRTVRDERTGRHLHEARVELDVAVDGPLEAVNVVAMRVEPDARAVIAEADRVAVEEHHPRAIGVAADRIVERSHDRSGCIPGRGTTR